jgi:hypothetical protein
MSRGEEDYTCQGQRFCGRYHCNPGVQTEIDDKHNYCCVLGRVFEKPHETSFVQDSSRKPTTSELVILSIFGNSLMPA